MLLAVLLVSACGAPAAAPPASAAPGAADPAKPAPPSSVVWDVVLGAVNHVDGARLSGFPSTAMLRTMYEPLFTFVGADISRIQPLLASSYTQSADYKTLTVKLRTNAKFSDGTPITSADWVWTLDRNKNLKDKASVLLAGVTWTAPDASTLVFTSQNAMSELPVILVSPFLAVMNSKLLKANGGTDAADADKTDKADAFLDKTSAGSGPYILNGFTPLQRVEVIANPNYWGSRKPAFKQIVITNSPGGQPEVQNLEAGVAQIAVDMTPRQAAVANLAPSAKVPAGLQLFPAAGISVIPLYFNMDPAVSKVTSNQSFRTAVRHAIDYAAIVRLAGEGSITPSSFIPNPVSGSLPVAETPKQDLVKAKAALAASGLVNPTVTLDFATDQSFNGLSPQDFAQIIQANLAAIGIKVNLNGGPNAAVYQQKGVFGLTELGLFPSTRGIDPAQYAAAYCPIPPVATRVTQVNPNGVVRFFIGQDPQTDTLCNTARGAAPAARVAAFQTLARRMNEVSPYITVIGASVNVMSDKRLTNAVYSPSALLDWYTIGQTGADPGKNE